MMPEPALPLARRSLRRQVLGMFSAAWLMVLVAIAAGVYYFVSTGERRAWEGRQSEAAASAGGTVAAFVRRAQDSLIMAGGLSRAALAADSQAVDVLLRQNTGLAEIIRLDGQARVLADAFQDAPLLAELYTVAGSGWFLDARAGQEYLGELEISAANEPYLILALPVSDGGVVAGRLRMDVLWEVVGGIEFGRTGHAYVINRDGMILAHTDPAVVLARTSIAGRPELEAMLAAAQSRWTGTYRNVSGTWVVGVTAPIRGTPWILITELDRAEAFATSRVAVLLLGSGIALVGILFAAAMSRVSIRYVFQRLDALRSGAGRAAAGDLDHRLAVSRNDEIGQVAFAFNDMAARLQELLRGEQEQRGELQRLMRAEHEQRESLARVLAEIQKVAHALGRAGDEILAASTQLVAGAAEQSAAIAQTSTTVDEVKVIAAQAVARAQEVTGTAQRTVEVSRTGQQAVRDTVDSMARIKDQMAGIAQNIAALSNRTEQVGDIIATVNELAVQSNMLALNAAVEAARAGEQGRSFAVVAQEVRSLAEQSSQATAQVKLILDEIQKATSATVFATDEGTRRVDEGMRLAAQTGETIRQLAGVIDESAQSAVQMVAGGRQQAAGIEQIALAMQHIHQATVQSLSSTRQAEKAARDLNSLARRLTFTSDQYQP